MARAKFHAYELDGTFNVEQGIASGLEEDGRAVVPVTALEKVFEIEDEDGQHVDNCFDAKCAFLCEKFNCNSRRMAGQVVFEKWSAGRGTRVGRI